MTPEENISSLHAKALRLAAATAHLGSERGYKRFHAYRNSEEGRQWYELDNGLFSQVLRHPEHPGLVVKISGRSGFGVYSLDAGYGFCGNQQNPNEDRGQEDAWPVYGKFCLDNAHIYKHLPRVYTLEYVGSQQVVAVMEQLVSAEIESEDYDPYDLRSTWLSWRAQLKGAKRPESPWMEHVKRMGGVYKMDLHSGNVMMRYTEDGPVLVMTDPLSWPIDQDTYDSYQTYCSGYYS